MYVICVCCLVCIWTFSILMSWECRITYTHKTDHFLILRNRNVTAVAQEEGCFWLTLTLVSVPAEEASLKIYLKGRAVNLYAPSSVTDYNIAKPGELPSEKLQLEWVYPSCWHTFSWWLWVVWVFWRGGGVSSFDSTQVQTCHRLSRLRVQQQALWSLRMLKIPDPPLDKKRPNSRVADQSNPNDDSWWKKHFLIFPCLWEFLSIGMAFHYIYI